MTMDNFLAALPVLSVQYLMNIISALLIFFVGRWIANRITNVLEKVLHQQKLDVTLIKFVGNLCYYALSVFVVLAALGRLGIQTASFVAVLGAAGLAVGMALQGALSNFAAGVMIIIFRPFRVGDAIKAAGITGTVEGIQIFDTVLITPNNVKIIIPNSKILGEPVENYTALGTRRLEIVVGVSYGDDLKKVRRVLEETLAQDPRILKNPAPVIGVKELAESCVNVGICPTVKSGDFGAVSLDIYERIKDAFDKNNISIPFPQRDVHLFERKNIPQ